MKKKLLEPGDFLELKTVLDNIIQYVLKLLKVFFGTPCMIC